MVEIVTCDGCTAKGEEREAVTSLDIAGDSYDLCDEHGERFRAYFADLFNVKSTTAVSA